LELLFSFIFSFWPLVYIPFDPLGGRLSFSILFWRSLTYIDVFLNTKYKQWYCSQYQGVHNRDKNINKQSQRHLASELDDTCTQEPALQFQSSACSGESGQAQVVLEQFQSLTLLQVKYLNKALGHWQIAPPHAHEVRHCSQKREGAE